MHQNFCSGHHVPKYLSSLCAEILVHGVTLDAAPKFWYNLPITLDMLTVTWIFSSLGLTRSNGVGLTPQNECP